MKDMTVYTRASTDHFGESLYIEVFNTEEEALKDNLYYDRGVLEHTVQVTSHIYVVQDLKGNVLKVFENIRDVELYSKRVKNTRITPHEISSE